MSVAAGRFRTIGHIEYPNPEAEPDATGRVDLSDPLNWSVLWVGKLELLPVTMREQIYAAQPVAAGTHRVTLRRDSISQRITPRMRVRVDHRTLNINGIIEIGNPPRLIELHCTETP